MPSDGLFQRRLSAPWERAGTPDRKLPEEAQAACTSPISRKPESVDPGFRASKSPGIPGAPTTCRGGERKLPRAYTSHAGCAGTPAIKQKLSSRKEEPESKRIHRAYRAAANALPHLPDRPSPSVDATLHACRTH